MEVPGVRCDVICSINLSGARFVSCVLIRAVQTAGCSYGFGMVLARTTVPFKPLGRISLISDMTPHPLQIIAADVTAGTQGKRLESILTPWS